MCLCLLTSLVVAMVFRVSQSQCGCGCGCDVFLGVRVVVESKTAVDGRDGK